MSVKITEIAELDADSSNPVLLRNMYRYWWQLFGAKGFRARDNTVPAMDGDGSNMVFLAGERQLYRGYIGGLDVEDGQRSAPKRAAAEPLLTYVAKRNRVTGQMRLVEVVSCQLSHVCHDSPRGSQATTGPMDERTLRMMRQKFDSKAHLAHLQRVYGKKLDLNVIQDKLERTMAEWAVKGHYGAGSGTGGPQGDGAEDERMLREPAVEIRAKANPLATRLCDLYSYESLIGKDLLSKLTKPAKKLLQTSPEKLSMANAYLENHVKALMQSEDVSSEKSLQTARVCLFMDVLVRVFSRAMNRTIHHGKISPFAEVLDELVRKQFLQCHLLRTGSKLVSSRSSQMKALLYYLALVFTVEGLETLPAKVVYHSLQINKIELHKYASLLGAVFRNTLGIFVLGKMPKPKTEVEEVKDAMMMATRKKR